MVQFSLTPSPEAADLADDIRELFDELSRTLDRAQRAYSGECHPALDVLETDEAIEVWVDVAGVPAEALRVLFRAGVLLVVGEKAPGPATGEQTFHLVERAFGRFARAVRLTGAFDLQKTRATLRDGELTIALPKLEDRRGRAHRIPIAHAPTSRT
ncbi:MAG: Hsp20/alpha crystallin family protein [Acidobacteria bacterium]|nr:Hsp20/alpha crystallin family protein [Acidobacteriota bacterium]